MAVWYIGEGRAAALLDYALARLAEQAHYLTAEQYFLLRKFLEARIPLWVEERRGPLDRQGKPLLSEKGYKDFIRWWVQELVKARSAATKEEPTVTANHWAEEAYGTKKTMGASALRRPLAAAEIEDIMALMPEVWAIGEDRANMLKGWVLEKLVEYTDQWYQTNPNAAKAFIEAVYNDLSARIDIWMANESKSPVNPKTKIPFAREVSAVGINQADQVRRAVDEMVYETVVTRATTGGSNRPSSLGWYGAYGQTPASYTGQAFIPYDAFVSQFPLRQYDAGTYNPDPSAGVSAVPSPVTSSSFAAVYDASGDLGAFAHRLIYPDRVVRNYNDGVAEVEWALNRWPRQDQYLIETKYNGEVSASGMATYNTAKDAFEAYALAEIKNHYI